MLIVYYDVATSKARPLFLKDKGNSEIDHKGKEVAVKTLMKCITRFELVVEA